MLPITHFFGLLLILRSLSVSYPPSASCTCLLSILLSLSISYSPSFLPLCTHLLPTVLFPYPSPAPPPLSLYLSPIHPPPLHVCLLLSSLYACPLPTLLSLCLSPTHLFYACLLSNLLSLCLSSIHSPLSMPVFYPLSSLYACLLHTSSMPVCPKVTLCAGRDDQIRELTPVPVSSLYLSPTQSPLPIPLTHLSPSAPPPLPGFRSDCPSIT